MDAPDLTRLIAQYESSSDAELAEAYAAGAEGYRDASLWQAIAAEYQRRRDQLPAEESAGADSPLLHPGHVTGRSSWFIAAWLNKQGPWDPAEALPLKYLYVHAILVGLVCLAGGFILVAYSPSSLVALLVSGLLLAQGGAFVWGVFHRTPAGWYAMMVCVALAVLFSLVSPNLTVQSLASSALSISLFTLYMGRRRAMWGLPPWPTFL